jgi:uncharacterized membrane protein
MVRHLDKHAKYEIVEALRLAEQRSSGEIRVHVKPRCGPDAMKEAKKIFRKLRMYRTRQRNAVLIFVALDSRRFALVGDVGIHQKVGDDFWIQTRDVMRGHFSKKDIVGGIVAGVQSVGEKLKEYFPVDSGNPNELSNTVSEG